MPDEKKPTRVLFSVLAGSDPARGEHDGPMLHILRYERPDAVMLFLTKEFVEQDQKDHRIEKTWELMQTKWEYKPELILYQTDKNPSNLDEVEKPLREAMQQLVDRYPGAEVMLNLSSGTPQMQVILTLLALELRSPSAIQVPSYKGKANDAKPSTANGYDVDTQLKEAEANETPPDADKKRCKPQELLPIRRNQQREQIISLLKSKDYQAVVAILSSRSILPTEALAMAKHLAARYDLHRGAARKALHGLNLDFVPYPKKQEATDEQKKEFTEVSEYFLMMKNFAETGRYTDFVLRLNPLTIRLQEALLDSLLLRQYKIPLQALKGPGKKVKREQLLAANLSEYLPELLNQLNEYLTKHSRKPFHDCDPSIYIYNLLLSFFPMDWLEDGEKGCLDVLKAIDKLNQEGRNLAAHNLTANITDADIQEEAGCSCAELVQKLEQAIIFLYPACDKSIFNIYQKCEKYILDRL